MNVSPLERQSNRLLQLGAALLLFTALQGFVLPAMRVPQLALAAHSRVASQGVMFLVFGLVWPRLKVGRMQSLIAFWTYLYSSLVTLVAYLLAAIWGAGHVAIPLAAGSAQGTVMQENVIQGLLFTAAPTFLVAIIIILWGLRPISMEK
jgi:hypothetical protein